MTAAKRTAKRASTTKPATKRPAIKRPAPKLTRPATSRPEVVRSGTGAELIDGKPYFGTVDGVRMNRRQYLDATRDARKAKLVEELRTAGEVDADG